MNGIYNDQLNVIIGITSFVGHAIALQLLKLGQVVIGTYHNDTLGLLSDLQAQPSRPKLYTLNVLDTQAIQEFCRTLNTNLINKESTLNIIYCCGRWHQGRIETITANEIDLTLGINLKAPMFLASILLQTFPQSLRLVFLTGLPSLQGGIEGCSLYSTCTNGIYIFVKTLAMELLARPNSYCIGLSLGLYDKGQSYYRDLVNDLKLPNYAGLNDVSDFIIYLMRQGFPILNGAFIELSNGVKDYGKIIKWLNK